MEEQAIHVATLRGFVQADHPVAPGLYLVVKSIQVPPGFVAPIDLYPVIHTFENACRKLN